MVLLQRGGRSIDRYKWITHDRGKTFDSLLTGEPFIPFHAPSELAEIVLGAIMLVPGKGKRLHRMLGPLWMGLMLASAISSMLIYGIRNFGPLSPIHGLAVLTVVLLFFAVRTTGAEASPRITQK